MVLSLENGIVQDMTGNIDATNLGADLTDQGDLLNVIDFEAGDVGDNVTFNVKLKSDSLKGLVRFSGRKDSTGITGMVTLPNGATIPWIATMRFTSA